jgi:arginyl-tRNA synthetase
MAQLIKTINFGLVHVMSTRRGTVKFLDDILRDTVEKINEVMSTRRGTVKFLDDILRDTVEKINEVMKTN